MGKIIAEAAPAVEQELWEKERQDRRTQSAGDDDGVNISTHFLIPLRLFLRRKGLLQPVDNHIVIAPDIICLIQIARGVRHPGQ